MNGEAIVIAAIASAGPLVAALAAWRQAKGTRAEVATNHGKRAGEYLEMLADVSADVQVMKIESRLSNARLTKRLENLHTEHGEILGLLDERVRRIEDAVDPNNGLAGGRIAQ